MHKSFLAIISIFLFSSFIGYLTFNTWNSTFEKLNPEEMYQRIIEERDFAISQAVTRGDFRCCINPPCTMCYMEANQWNNYTPGTCACDDLIAQGKEPCPQCRGRLCGGGDSTCNFKPADTQQ